MTEQCTDQASLKLFEIAWPGYYWLYTRKRFKRRWQAFVVRVDFDNDGMCIQRCPIGDYLSRFHEVRFSGPLSPHFMSIDDRKVEIPVAVLAPDMARASS